MVPNTNCEVEVERRDTTWVSTTVLYSNSIVDSNHRGYFNQSEPKKIYEDSLFIVTIV